MYLWILDVRVGAHVSISQGCPEVTHRLQCLGRFNDYSVSANWWLTKQVSRLKYLLLIAAANVREQTKR